MNQGKKRSKLLLPITALICVLSLLPFFKAAGESTSFPSNIRVAMLQQIQEVSFTADGKYQLVNLSTGNIIADINPKEKWTAVAGSDLIKLTKNDEQIGAFSGPIVARESKYLISIVSDGGTVKNKTPDEGLVIQGAQQNIKLNEDFSQYKIQTSDGLKPVKVPESLNLITLINGMSKQRLRGSLELRSTKEGLTVINELPLEKYLCGVVPGEMPSDWPTEALKAQAVAARCYVLSQLGSKYSEQGFDVTNDQYSQAYRGYEGETKAGNLAVQETSGLVAVYKNKLINAFYHSSSGGFTENCEDVWTYELPYIKGKADPYDKNTNHYGWQVKFEQYELLQQLDKQDIKAWKEVKDIEILNLTSSGKRVQKLKLTGLDSDDKTVTVEFGNANNVRMAFGLKSAYFEMTKGFDTDNKLEQVTFTGSGWGHGLGMSQYGAAGMAKQGYTFKDILQYYYTDIDIKPNYGR